MIDCLPVEFKSAESKYNNCLCNCCHATDKVVKVSIPSTLYYDGKKLTTKYSALWICKDCRDKLAKALYPWDERQTDNRWKQVSEKPESGQDVIVYIEDDCYDMLTYYNKGDELYDEYAAPDVHYADADGFYIYKSVDGKIKCCRHADIITYWMPLPEAPQSRKLR